MFRTRDSARLGPGLPFAIIALVAGLALGGAVPGRAAPDDTTAPTVGAVTLTPPPAGSQRASATVSGVDTAGPGVTPAGIARVEYSFDGATYAVASRAGAPPVSGNPASITDLAIDVDLAHPGAAGSWVGGARTLYVRLVDASGNTGAPGAASATVTVPGAGITRYLAEGYTGPGFDEYLTVANPSSFAIAYVSVRFQYAAGGGPVPGIFLAIAPSQRQTVRINDAAGAGKELSLKLESNLPFFAERPMYFPAYGSGGLGGISGGHLGVAAAAPAPAWYFAEGYTGPGFEGYFTIQNPQTSASTIRITYYLSGGGVNLRDLSVEAGRRKTVAIHGPADQGGIGPNQSFSARIETTNGRFIIVERVLYFRYIGSSFTATGGAATLGAVTPATTWYFAEGTTRPGFDQYVTIQNANPSAGSADLTYFVAGVGAVARTVPLPPNSRTTVTVHNDMSPSNPGGLGRGADGRGLDNSLKIVATVPVVAERPMYFVYDGGGDMAGVDGGHNVLGATGTLAQGQSAVMAEGYTGAGFHEYLTFQNPNATPATVRITYLRADGGTIVPPILTLPANQRTTVAVHNAADPTGVGLGPNQAFGVKVDVLSAGAGGVLVERVMYFRYQGSVTGGTTALAVRAG